MAIGVPHTCDASSVAGLAPGRYLQWGTELEILQSGKVVVPGTPYLAGSGLTTNAAVVGRGLFRAVRTACDGHFQEAGVEALGALASPALMSYGSLAGLVVEVLDAAQGLAGTALEEAMERRPVGRAA